MIVAFQGEHGAYSDEVLHRHFGHEPDLKTVPCHSLVELFGVVENGTANYGILPLENSLGGAVTGVNTLLLNHDLKASAEILHAVRHNLIVTPGGADQVTHVRSHPQALEQCRDYLQRKNYVAEAWYDTAGAAKSLAENPEPGYGAIASRQAAEYYKLEIADAGIEDEPNNSTRFLVIGHDEAEPCDDAKTSILFAVPDRPGALVVALQLFSERGINLTSISSFPRRRKQWNYVFYVDFLGHWREPHVQDALSELLGHSAFLKLLGSYPRAQTAETAENP